MATTKKPTAGKAKTTAAKPATTKPAAKKPAAKTAAKKPAVKKPAAKPAAKSTTKKPAVKSTAKKPAEATGTKKTSTKKAPADKAKFRNLFDAYIQEKLPRDQGYIVSSFFNETNAYSIYEIVSYAGVKEIFPSGEGLQFISGGKKLHILVEPDTYHNKPVEPVSRPEGEKIPKRFNELETYITKNQNRIYISKEPVETTGSFTVLKPKGINFAVVFYQLPDLFETIAEFFTDSLNKQRKVPQRDAKNAASLVVSIIKKTMGFEGLYK